MGSMIRFCRNTIVVRKSLAGLRKRSIYRQSEEDVLLLSEHDSSFP